MTRKVMTKEEFDALPPLRVFAKGFVMDGTSSFNFSNEHMMLRWVAKTGGNNDWAIYVSRELDTVTHVENNGDKVCSPDNIRYLVPCTDEVLARYRN